MGEAGIQGCRLRVSGRVQGVGFRPFVYRLACARGLTGWVRNDDRGVEIRVFGPPGPLRDFRDSLRHAPSVARIDHIDCSFLPGCDAPADFRVQESAGKGGMTLDVMPDLAVCKACLAEMDDPGNRRYAYPFINCVHCGPRYSLMQSLPYDRCRTTMAAFAFCQACLAEYQDPANRRFHAQPVACPDCGPQVQVLDAGATQVDVPWLDWARDRLVAGDILAIKGLGGFHLVCDATSAVAVARLRERKQRPDKPFALMLQDLAMVRDCVRLDAPAQAALEGPEAPIVLLPSRGLLPEGLNPGLRDLGVMLPYTPLHHLLLRAVGRPLVMTSGNRSGMPVCYRNDEALERLSGVADGFVMHNLVIARPLEDTVVRLVAGQPRTVRPGRGQAPAALPLPPGFAGAGDTLALGGQLKSSIALFSSGRLRLSEYLGDLDDLETLRRHRALVACWQGWFLQAGLPVGVVHDLHPDYASTREAHRMMAATGCTRQAVQHHHAHLAACLADNGWARQPGKQVLGILLDGHGLGDDGTLWGGEFLLGNYSRAERLGHLGPLPMPGGRQAILEPWRMGLAVLASTGHLACLPDLPMRVPAGGLALLQRDWPVTSSCGRCMDACAALLGLVQGRITYEGQAAMRLQALAESCDAAMPDYPFSLGRGVLDLQPLWTALLDDVRGQKPVDWVARRFHQSLVSALAGMVGHLAARADFSQVVLSGGVFQNALLLEGVVARLTDAGYDVLSQQRVPANDGGLALGQAMVASARTLEATGAN
jgi:hydrogenase maturation protein HypF